MSSTQTSPGRKLPGDEIYYRIREMILRHRIGPGTKLAEIELSRLFDVNRETVRRALIRLASDNIVEYFPKRGAFVARPTVDQVRQVREARMALEPEIVSALAKRADRQALDTLASLIDEQGSNQRNDKNPGTAVERSGAFHVQIADLIENPFCKKYMLELAAMTCLALVEFDVPRQEGCRLDQHIELVEAIRQGAPRLSADIMKNHIYSVHQAILDSAERTLTPRDLSALRKDV